MIGDPKVYGFYQAPEMVQRQRSTSDLSDREWERIKPLLPDTKPVGRTREVNLRDILDALFYRAVLSPDGD